MSLQQIKTFISKSFSQVQILIVTAFIFAVVSFNPNLSYIWDEGAYIIGAHSLDSGYGYSQINMPGNPPMRPWPPGFSLILSVVTKYFDSYIALKFLVLVFFIISVPVIYYLLLKVSTIDVAFASTLVFATAYFTLVFTHQVLSEIPYCFFSFSALYFVIKTGESNKFSVIPLFIAAFFTFASMETRSIGLANLLAGAMYLFIKKQFAKSLSFLSFAIVMAYILSFSIPQAVQGEINSLISFLKHQEFIKNFLSFPFKIIGTLFQFYLDFLGHIGVINFVFVKYFLGALAISATTVVLFGFFKSVRVAPLLVIQLYCIFYLGAIISIPNSFFVGQGLRYFVPILPFILLFIFRAFSLSPRKKFDHIRITSLSKTIWIIILIGNIGHSTYFVIKGNNIVSWSKRYNTPEAFNSPQREVFQMANWVRENTNPKAVVMVRNYFPFYLWSNRKTIPTEWVYSEDEIISLLAKHEVSYLVHAPEHQSTGLKLDKLLHRYPDFFKVVYQNKSFPHSVIYKVVSKEELIKH